ncbi:MAG: hypothetical protein AAF630_06645 [Cyanobacteria bacterium P01_C01_bin.38]
MKCNFPIWQITLPLAGVLMFSIGAITTIYMINGRYLFHLEASPQKVTITTDVDKRDSSQEKAITKPEKKEKIKILMLGN